ncbi:MAG: hypothetical protein AAGC77_09725 [Pseudomonadota bacterium]
MTMASGAPPVLAGGFPERLALVLDGSADVDNVLDRVGLPTDGMNFYRAPTGEFIVDVPTPFGWSDLNAADIASDPLVDLIEHNFCRAFLPGEKPPQDIWGYVSETDLIYAYLDGYDLGWREIDAEGPPLIDMASLISGPAAPIVVPERGWELRLAFGWGTSVLDSETVINGMFSPIAQIGQNAVNGPAAPAAPVKPEDPNFAQLFAEGFKAYFDAQDAAAAQKTANEAVEAAYQQQLADAEAAREARLAALRLVSPNRSNPEEVAAASRALDQRVARLTAERLGNAQEEVTQQFREAKAAASGIKYFSFGADEFYTALDDISIHAFEIKRNKKMIEVIDEILLVDGDISVWQRQYLEGIRQFALDRAMQASENISTRMTSVPAGFIFDIVGGVFVRTGLSGYRFVRGSAGAAAQTTATAAASATDDAGRAIAQNVDEGAETAITLSQRALAVADFDLGRPFAWAWNKAFGQGASKRASKVLFSTPVSELPGKFKSALQQIRANALRQPPPSISAAKAGEIMDNAILVPDELRAGASDTVPTLTMQRIRETGLTPKHTVTVGDKTIFISDPFEMGKGRVAYLAFIETPSGFQVQPFYRSASRGLWQAPPGFGSEINPIWLNKGLSGSKHSTILPIELQDQLSSAALTVPIVTVPGENVTFRFVLDGEPGSYTFDPGSALVYGALEYQTGIPTPRYLAGLEGGNEIAHNLRFVDYQPMAGTGGKHAIPETLDVISDAMAPNFGAPIKNFTMTFDPVLYPNGVTAHVFPSNNGKVHYMFLSDGQTVWLGQVDYVGAAVGEFGVRTLSFNPKNLTIAPVEYKGRMTPPNFAASDPTFTGPYRAYNRVVGYHDRVPLLQRAKSVLDPAPTQIFDTAHGGWIYSRPFAPIRETFDGSQVGDGDSYLLTSSAQFFFGEPTADEVGGVVAYIWSNFSDAELARAVQQRLNAGETEAVPEGVWNSLSEFQQTNVETQIRNWQALQESKVWLDLSPEEITEKVLDRDYEAGPILLPSETFDAMSPAQQDAFQSANAEWSDGQTSWFNDYDQSLEADFEADLDDLDALFGDGGQ